MLKHQFLLLSAAAFCVGGLLACGDDDDSCVCTVGEVVPLCQEKCKPPAKATESACTGAGGQAGSGGQSAAGGAGAAGASCQ